MLETLELTSGQVRAVFDALSMVTAPHSPLHPFASERAEPVAAPGGIWREAFEILADPLLEVRLLEGTPEGVLPRLYYRGNDPRSPLVRVDGVDQGVRLTAGYDSEAVTGDLAGMLWAGSGPEGVDYRASLSPAGLAAWAACLDHLRAQLCVSLLHRAPGMDLTLSLEELDHNLAVGLEAGDGRWMVTLLNFLAPNGLLAADAAERGARELERLGLLRPSSGGWLPSGEMLFMGASLQPVLPAAACVLTRFGRDKAEVNYSVALTGAGRYLWTLGFEERGGGDVEITLASCSGGELADWMKRQVSDAPGRRAGSGEASGSRCVSCGAELKPGAAFCSSCGHQVEEAHKQGKCISCGAALKPDAAFCSRCGAKQG
ncbi:zinc-ribbon domain-containing protein [Pseudodesulfovibrio cashew]|uniref:Zinc-ribbon domain-containing protein n=1 Tax=Pseudodesulfovibrio cashew TaxID=2678688 RepID=A0A6I6JCB6_9BACT|nr:zinc ribbon domain-containing protein [Pseudodesulfovibrio cashew]QGY38690.1 zinc-ribbon domain-containing protein [Pseudodesulfovibrio cashew]